MIGGVGVGRAVKRVLDHAHRDRRAIGAPAVTVPAQCAPIRAIGVALQHGQAQRGRGAPDQLGAGGGRPLPESTPQEAAIGDTEHIPREGQHHVRGQRDFPRRIGAQLGGTEDMRAGLQQPNEVELGKRTRGIGHARTGRAAERRAFGRCIPPSNVAPSRLRIRHSRYHAPEVVAVATGATRRRYSASSGSAPSRVRAWEMPDHPAGSAWVAGSPSHRAPASRPRSTSRGETSAYNASAIA